jgi:NADH-quinone oxidoreductase subunit E
MMTGQTDEKFEQVCKIIEKHDTDGAKLIPILHDIQGIYRYLPEDVLHYTARKLKVPFAQVYGVATFYSHFSLSPKGKYVVKICNGTACHVKKSVPLLEAICKRLNLSDKKMTTDDQLFTVELVSCLGACGLAPVLVINDDVHGLMTPAKAVAEIEKVINLEGGK